LLVRQAADDQGRAVDPGLTGHQPTQRGPERESGAETKCAARLAAARAGADRRPRCAASRAARELSGGADSCDRQPAGQEGPRPGEVAPRGQQQTTTATRLTTSASSAGTPTASRQRGEQHGACGQQAVVGGPPDARLDDPGGGGGSSPGP